MRTHAATSLLRCAAAVLLIGAAWLPSLAVSSDAALQPTVSYVFGDGFEEYVQRYVADIGAEPLRAPATAAFEPGNTLTLEGWFFLAEPLPNAWLMGKAIPLQGGFRTLIFSLILDQSGTRFRFGTATFGIEPSNPIALRTWTHVAAVMDNGAARLYVNGAFVASNPNAGSISSAPTIPLGIGGVFNESGEHDHGSLPGIYARQLRFWNIARTQAQIASARDEFLPSNSQGLVAAWPLDERGGTNANDVSGNDRDLTKAVAVGASRVAVLEDGPHFARTTVTLPTGVMTDASDTAVIDFDNDGDLDLIIAQVAAPTFPATQRRLLAFRNDSGTFVESTSTTLGNLQLINPRRLGVADFNADGRPDLFIAETGTDTDPFPGAQSRILIQSATGQLVDETATRLPARDSYTHGLTIADIDGDGDLDVLMINYIRDVPRIYLNDGTGHFTDAPPGVLPADIASGAQQYPTGEFCDVNVDGRPDLVLGGNYYAPSGPGSSVPNVLLMNDGTGRFVRDPAFTLPPKLHGIAGVTVEVDCADLNADGAPELVLGTDINAQVPGLQLLLNDGIGHFTDATAQLNLEFSSTDKWVVATAIADVNGDGKPDIVLRVNSRNFSPANFSRSILLNRGGAVFVDASEAFAANTIAGISVGDFDRDGLLDLLAPNSQNGLRIYRGLKTLGLGLFTY